MNLVAFDRFLKKTKTKNNLWSNKFDKFSNVMFHVIEMMIGEIWDYLIIPTPTEVNTADLNDLQKLNK